MRTGDHERVVPLGAPAARATAATPPTDPLAALNLVGVEEFSKPIPPVTYAVDPLFPTDSIVVIGGAAGAKKSFVGLASAIAVATGTPCMGRFGTKPGWAIYLNFEAGKTSFRRRLHGLSAGIGAWPPYLKIGELPTLGLNDPAFPTAIAAVVQQFAPVLIVIDTWRAALPGVDENESTTRRFVDQLRRIIEPAGTCVVILTHTRKLRDGKREYSQDDIRGSGALVEAADVAFILARAKQKGGPSLLVQTKARDAEEIEDHYIDLIKYDNGALSVAATPSSVAEQADETQKNAELNNELINFIASNPGCSQTEIRNAVKKNKALVADRLKNLVENNQLKVHSAGGNKKAYFLRGQTP